ncbi:hypothetical protein [Methylobacterium sp. CM6247]
MGVTIPKGAAFLGIPLIKIRNLLRGWRHGDRRDLWRLAVRKDIDLDPRTVMVLLEELRDRGLLGLEEQEHGPPKDGLTEAGLALSGAIARRRTPKPHAQAILDRFLDACATVNETKNLPFDVRQVWLFGSMIDAAKADVGDIDLVVEQGRPEAFATWDRAQARFKELGKEMGAPRQSGLMSIIGDQRFVERKLLHGDQRHALLSMNSSDELRDMACPCQLIFDASRGGRVSDPVLPRHPDSIGRSNRIAEKRRMPDLSDRRQPLRPISASLMTRRYIGYQTLKAVGPWPEDSWAYRGVDKFASAMGIIADGIVPPRYERNALTKRMQFSECDGRERVGLLLIETRQIDPGTLHAGYAYSPLAAIVLKRTLHENGSALTYSLDVVEADHLGKGVEYAWSLAFEWWIHFMATADLERIIRREQETGSEFELTASISFSADRSIAEMLSSLRALQDRSLIDETRAGLRAKADMGFRPKEFFRD